MKVFISSVIRDLEAHRDAANRAARALRHEVKRAEDFTASAATPQQACLAGVRWAEVVILILGARYGDRQASGLSATHEEYREARERRPVLVFVQQAKNFEPAQEAFIREVQDWSTGHFTARFSSVDDLRDEVTAALRDIELSRATGPVDEKEMLNRAKALLPDSRHSLGVAITLVVAGGPRQQVLRPKELEAPDLEEAITKEALFGPCKILNRKLGTESEIRDDALLVMQEKGSIYLDQLGTVRLIVPVDFADEARAFGSAGVAIQEQVEETLERMLHFSSWLLDHVDRVQRISDVVPVAALDGALTLRTQAEHNSSPHSYTVRLSNEAAVVHLNPARRYRAALKQDSKALAEDLVALISRRMRQ
jgi:hypothetical protein